MSKSDPDNAIFMDDSEQEVKRKIKKAYCKPKEVEGNPLLDWTKWILFPILGRLVIPAEEKWGTPEKVFNNYQDLEKEFVEEKVHPNDLKKAMVIHINELLEPVRNHFKNNDSANKLLKTVKSYKK